MIYLIAGLIGIVSGVISGLLGVGGGIVMVPAMIALMKVDAKIAIGTSLAVIVPTAMMGTYKHFIQENVDWRVFLMLAPLAIVGGYCGAHLAEQLPDATLKRLFGIFVIVVGVRMAFFK